jgi:hypothetical protein
MQLQSGGVVSRPHSEQQLRGVAGSSTQIFPVQLKVLGRCEAIVNGILDAITDESVENLAGRERNAAG